MSVMTAPVDSARVTALAKARNAALQDRLFFYIALASAALVVLLLLGVLVSLLIGAWPAATVAPLNSGNAAYTPRSRSSRHRLPRRDDGDRNPPAKLVVQLARMARVATGRQRL